MNKINSLILEAAIREELFTINAFEKLEISLQEEFLKVEELISKATTQKEMQLILEKKFFKTAKEITIPIVDKNGKIKNWNFANKVASEFQNNIKQLALDTTLANMEEYDLDIVEFSTHDNARESCSLDQGKLYSLSNWSGSVLDYDGSTRRVYPISESTYGEVAGIMGVNCRHQMYPYTYDKIVS